MIKPELMRDVEPVEQEVEQIEQEAEQIASILSSNAGYKIDKNVKPQYMRKDRQTRSLHYVHAML